MIIDDTYNVILPLAAMLADLKEHDALILIKKHRLDHKRQGKTLFVSPDLLRQYRGMVCTK